MLLYSGQPSTVMLRVRMKASELPVYFGDDFRTFFVKLRKADLMFQPSQLQRGLTFLNLGVFAIAS